MRQITNVNNEKKINNHLDENEIKQHSKIESQTIGFDFRESLTQEKIMNIRSSLQQFFRKKKKKMKIIIIIKILDFKELLIFLNLKIIILLKNKKKILIFVIY